MSIHHHHDENHPSRRPVEPEHPMVLEGGVTQGDTAFMLRCMAEEFLIAGTSAASLVSMLRDPEYQALHAAVSVLGSEAAEAIVEEAASRVGVHRHSVRESLDQWSPATLTIGGGTERKKPDTGA